MLFAVVWNIDSSAGWAVTKVGESNIKPWGVAELEPGLWLWIKYQKRPIKLDGSRNFELPSAIAIAIAILN